MKILCAVLEQDDLGKHSHRRTYSQSSGTQDPQFMPQVWCFYYCIHWLVTLTGTLPLPPDVELSQDSNHAHPVILFPAQRHFTLWCNNIMNERKNECILVTKVFLSHQSLSYEERKQMRRTPVRSPVCRIASCAFWPSVMKHDLYGLLSTDCF